MELKKTVSKLFLNCFVLFRSADSFTYMDSYSARDGDI